MLSHGFLKNSVNKASLSRVKFQCKEFLKSQKNISNYYKIEDKNTFDSKQIISQKIFNNITNLLKDKKPKLCAIELHIQKKQGIPIPPHQDNFYHCVEPEDSIKILIPLNPLNKDNGGLFFINSDVNFPVLDHVPSKVKNFSSYIDKSVMRTVKKNALSYDYQIGDASYHFVNSIHFSEGNKTNKDSLFLVFRYQKRNAKSIPFMQEIYDNCYKKHLRFIEESDL